MEIIDVKVCMGTSCFGFNSSHLQELKELAEKKYKDKVKVEGSPCSRACSVNWENPKAPYVTVNEEVIPEATTEKVIAEIERQLSHQKV